MIDFEKYTEFVNAVTSEDSKYGGHFKDRVRELDSKEFKHIETFFETMPKLSHTVKVTNPKTKVESDVTLEGITNFFG